MKLGRCSSWEIIASFTRRSVIYSPRISVFQSVKQNPEIYLKRKRFEVNTMWKASSMNAMKYWIIFKRSLRLFMIEGFSKGFSESVNFKPWTPERFGVNRNRAWRSKEAKRDLIKSCLRQLMTWKTVEKIVTINGKREAFVTIQNIRAFYDSTFFNLFFV